MAGWSGWINDLIAALGVPATNKNRTFLGEWQAAEHTDCANNPLSAIIELKGSTRCKELSSGDYAQAYATHTSGLNATVEQLNEPRFAAILKALESGDPFSYADWQDVVGALGTWGAHTFANQYASAQEASGGAGLGDLASTLSGFAAFDKSLARTLPTSLRRARFIRQAALRRLGAPHSLS